jgi:putative phage-type endonuclease
MSLTDEQVAERFTGIGGSDAAPALGISPWKSPLELFLDKREKRVGIGTLEAMRWGTLLEPVIRQEYSNLTRRVVRMPEGTLRHPRHKFMLAHVDGVTDDGRIFEAKTARSAEGWGRTGTDEVPHHYLVQVQHYMAVSGLSAADIAVLIGGSDFRIYEILADTELQGEIIEGEREFWKLVEDGTPPPPNWDTIDIDLLKRLYPGTDGKTLVANDTDEHWRAVFEEALEKAKSNQKVADVAKLQLLAKMGEASRLVFEDNVQFTRKRIERKGYTIAATSFIDARFSKIKEPA